MIAIKSKIETKSSILSTAPPPFVPVSLDLFFLAGFPKPIEALGFGNCIIHNLHYWVISGYCLMTRVLIIWKVHLVQVQITGTASFNLPGIRMGDDYIAATPQPPFFFKGV